MRDGIFLDLYKQKIEFKGTFFEWVVVNTRFNNLKIRFDFSGSENMTFNGPEVQSIAVEPNRSMLAVSARHSAVAKAFKLMFKWSIAVLPPSIEQKNQLSLQTGNEIQNCALQLSALHLDPFADGAVRLLEEHKLHFVDASFPPNNKSISPTVDVDNVFGDVIYWKRAADFMRISRGVDGISPLDISQGALGNCWFCCALSTLAEQPASVDCIFVTKDHNPFGLYRLRLCKDGLWSDVVLDDYFPRYASRGPVFSSNRSDVLWVSLIEKAYAKVHGSYYNVRSGRPCDAMADLTGCPCEFLSFATDSDKREGSDRAEKLWETLLSCSSQRQLMSAGTAAGTGLGEDTVSACPVNPEREVGLVPGHAYSILDVKAGLGQRLLKLRNPWSTFEWGGAWSDDSDLWTEEAKAPGRCFGRRAKRVMVSFGCVWRTS